MPIHIVSWKKAVTLVFRQRAEFVEFHEEEPLRSTNNSVSTNWGLPAVVRLIDFNFPPKGNNMYQHLNKHNLLMREGGKCMYCQTDLSTRNMTMDHVVPKSQGGKKTWTNLVCSCKKCNGTKNNRTPAEAGMELAKKPYAPTLNSSIVIKVQKELNKYKRIPDTWKKYIIWKA